LHAVPPWLLVIGMPLVQLPSIMKALPLLIKIFVLHAILPKIVNLNQWLTMHLVRVFAKLDFMKMQLKHVLHAEQELLLAMPQLHLLAQMLPKRLQAKTVLQQLHPLLAISMIPQLVLL
jgi:hypothetical protein